MVFRKGKMNICGFYGSFLLLVVLSHVVSVLVFPSFPDIPRKKSDICHVLLIDESQDPLPLQDFAHSLQRKSIMF